MFPYSSSFLRNISLLMLISLTTFFSVLKTILYKTSKHKVSIAIIFIAVANPFPKLGCPIINL